MLRMQDRGCGMRALEELESWNLGGLGHAWLMVASMSYGVFSAWRSDKATLVDGVPLATCITMALHGCIM